MTDAEPTNCPACGELAGHYVMGDSMYEAAAGLGIDSQDVDDLSTMEPHVECVHCGHFFSMSDRRTVEIS